MYLRIVFMSLWSLGLGHLRKRFYEDQQVIQMYDMTNPTTWKDLTEYYTAVERGWKICTNCGFPGFGTGMHLGYSSDRESMQPAVIPTEYLLTRLVIIDVTALAKKYEGLTLTLDVARQWIAIKQDPSEPTLLVFKFGWKPQPQQYRKSKCYCHIPGLGYDLAQWIAANLSHVVGVATDAPSLESEHTREQSTDTIGNLLGRSGIYMIENVNLRRHIPESGCLATAMPLKLEGASFAPTRLACFCAPPRSGERVVLAHRQAARARTHHSRTHDVDLDEILNMI